MINEAGRGRRALSAAAVPVSPLGIGPCEGGVGLRNWRIVLR